VNVTSESGAKKLPYNCQEKKTKTKAVQNGKHEDKKSTAGIVRRRKKLKSWSSGTLFSFLPTVGGCQNSCG